ncbi:50S ribosomal protein L13 [Coxiella burnetii]|uniref:Large ribosomal subunit protein uL13 n=1 Tax=Coxiella burnetii (strain CbuG_Q212) TaxID=434923 RepID=RL13_COXB2|nr:50S ribosomal protein L13 [Coxiella burnetii]B6J2V1.1 RecName: Full=Large ribosomal subunit protein uL13; AltName: Full=50S ribosomal protein L13 [Coxiella burnetii CbuG_Q212]ACJ17581.1 LSU ribosomal protein L13P [Coxiella burnetii CbuG_Q212]ATN66048.1 50S ribosomal protein L13 [Coxiella burnetii]OYK87042.1 50S ribosomal protein L13 [Coxiella burnetii]
MATYMANAKTVSPRWLLVNAEGKTLGRLASRIAAILRGKHKAEFTPHVDAGDFVVVINVDKLKITGNKTQDKQYHHHSGYPGGLKTINFADLQAKKPQRILELAIKGMLPKGPLGRQLYRKLKIYAGDQHPHQAQQPELIDL